MRMIGFLTSVVEATQPIDYTGQLGAITEYASQLVDASVWIVSFLLFFVVVVLCYFAYKFFRIFL